MITLLGSLLGFFSAALPDFVKIWQDNREKAHQIELIKLQMGQDAALFRHKMEEIDAKADIEEAKSLYKTYKTNIYWVDALNGTVRPVLAYAFFLLYSYVKVMQIYFSDMSTFQGVMAVWGQEDQAIFAGIISFYFGQRAMRKIREIH